ncbi:hypothetical protein [Helicobacter sp. T3_23-1056]
MFARNDSNAKSFNERIFHSLADLHTSCPPSLAEGARGWVSCHTERSEVSQNANKNRDISLSRTQYDKETSVIASATCCAWQSMTFIIARIFNVIARFCVITIANKCFSVIASKNERKRVFAWQSTNQCKNHRLPRVALQRSQ